ncbi:MAG: hypothetical protein AAF499_12745, partial [Pseudomonadota bacterium]
MTDMIPDTHEQIDRHLLFGRPSQRVSGTLISKLSQLVADIQPVREAYLPEVKELGLAMPASLAFFLVVDPPSRIEQVRQQIDRKIGDILPVDLAVAVRVITPDY